MQNKRKIQHDEDCDGGGAVENKGWDGDARSDTVSG
jgi:hypothetical protein